MRNARFLTLLLAAAVSVVPLAAQTAHKSSVAKAQIQAQQIIEKGIEAIGGMEAIRSVKTLEYELKGEGTPRHQTTTASAPFEANTFWERTRYDLTSNKISFENAGTGGGFNFKNRTVVANNQGTNINYTAKTFAPLPPNPNIAPVVVQYTRRLPNLILNQANNRILTARYLGTDTFEGRKHNVVTFTMLDGQQTALFFDAATNLLSKYENAYTDSVTDTDVLEYIYGGYKQVGNLKLPSNITIRQAGQVTSKWNIDVKVNPTFDEQTFVAKAEGFKELPAQGTPATPKTVKLGENAVLLHGLGGGAYNVLAVAFKDHIFAFEAPLNSATADAAIRMIKEAFPNKPIKYVALTHFHNDHSGGLRSFVAEGATIVTTAGNKSLFEAMVNAKFNDSLAKNPKKAQFEIISGKKVFTDGETSLEVADIGPNPHAKEMLVGYLPKDRVLFQGDLFGPPNDERFPVGPAAEATEAFFQKLKASNWAVDKLVGVHGRISNMDELAKAVSDKAGAGEVKAAGQ
jgi:glyoxylase-like metal-dependent hydrolase (beta-lactamase superfamily II)